MAEKNIENSTASADAPVDVSDLPPVREHGELAEITDGVYYVEGTAHMGWVTFPRGMTVVVENGQLSLVNPIRLSADGEAELLRLGDVKHVVCLGCHSIDVAYYARRFKATVHAFPDRKFKQEEVQAVDIRQGLPFGRATFVNFERMPKKMPEAVVLLHRDDGDVLVTCDAVQNWENAKVNWLGRFVLPWHGFAGKCIFDKFLINLLVKHIDMSDIKKDMAKLLDLNFRVLLSGHGCVTDGSAQEAMHQSFVAMFGPVDSA